MSAMTILAPILVLLFTGQAADNTRSNDLKNVGDLRVATFNVSLFRDEAGRLAKDLVDGKESQAHRLATVIQLVRPDVLLLNEIDYEQDSRAAKLFMSEYLGVPHGRASRIAYPHWFSAPVNTGVPSGIDLDNDGSKDGWNDCFGFGKYPGQYGMLVLSKYPIRRPSTRTFQTFRWKDMPNANLPTTAGKPFFSDQAWNAMRLSSKSHWDVAIEVQNNTLHLLACHPTPPVFDGPEDRNGKRNHDEIRFFADYISPGQSNYIVDDAGKRGGIGGDYFVVAGDLNADPYDGDSYQQAARILINHPLIQATPVPQSNGAMEASKRGVNIRHAGPASQDTADFDDNRTGNLRIDYVLPSRTLQLERSGVFWPKSDESGADIVRATDHRLVWIDVRFPNAN